MKATTETKGTEGTKRTKGTLLLALSLLSLASLSSLAPAQAADTIDAPRREWRGKIKEREAKSAATALSVAAPAAPLPALAPLAVAVAPAAPLDTPLATLAVARESAAGEMAASLAPQQSGAREWTIAYALNFEAIHAALLRMELHSRYPADHWTPQWLANQRGERERAGKIDNYKRKAGK